MPPYRRSRLLSRTLAACAVLALPLAMTGTAPASRTPTADAAGAKVAIRIVKLARKELAHGVHEIPDGSNRAPAIYRYDLATTPHYYGAPWCAYFASYVVRRAGVPIGPGGHGLGYVVDPCVGAGQRQVDTAPPAGRADHVPGARGCGRGGVP